MNLGLGLGISRNRVIGGGGFDSDFQAVLDYWTTQGYTLPSAGQQILLNGLTVAAKAAGAYQKLDMLSIRAIDGDSNCALTNWKTLTQHTAVNSPTFTADVGFTGNGSTSYIITDFDPDTATHYTQNDSMYGLWWDGTIAAGQAYMGSRAGSSARHYAYYAAYMVYQNAFYSTTADTTVGYRAFQRTDSSTIQRWIGGSLDESASVASASTAGAFPFFSLGVSNSGSLLFPSPITEKAIWAGAQLSSGEHSAFQSALSTYFAAI